MKITKSRLKKIIREELKRVMEGLDKTQAIGGGQSKSHPGRFDYDKNPVAEKKAFEEGCDGELEEKKKKKKKKKKDDNWIQDADKDIERRGTEGKCTPITKKGCTGRAKTLAKTFKKMAKDRKNK